MKDPSKRVMVAVCGSLFAAAEAREALYRYGTDVCGLCIVLMLALVEHRYQPSLFSSDDWVVDADPEIVMEVRKST